MVFHWSLSDSKSLQVSKTLLSILADLNNVVVWMVSTRPDYYYCYYLLIRVFHISVSWWSFTGDWLTASFLKSPGLFSVFWPFSIILLFGWSPLGRQLPNPPGPLITFSYRAKSTNHNWYNCHVHYYYYYYYYYTPCEFFTSVLTSSFSLKTEWQQVSSGPKDFSKYSSRF